jgi:hypothetical protein
MDNSRAYLVGMGRLTVLSNPKYVTDVPTLPSGPRPVEPTQIHDHAMDNLRFIRQTMENAGSFTAISGWGQIGIGVTALMAAAVASRQAEARTWLGTWLVEAVVAVVVGSWGITRKARATGLSLSSGPSRKFAICFAPPLIAGGVLTPVLYGAGMVTLLPGVWLLLFGVAVVTGGALSVKIVPLMGALFMALGVAALIGPARWGDLYMAIGFGVVLIVYGVIIARRYGG